MLQQLFFEQQDAAAVDFKISAISDGWLGDAPNYPDDLEYMRSYWEGKLTQIKAQFQGLMSQMERLESQVECLGIDLGELSPKASIVQDEPF